MNQPASVKDLRNFGLLVGGVFGIIGLWPMLVHGEELRVWALTIGALLISCGAIFPTSLVLVHKAWIWAGHILGWINTRILLGVVFYGLITPISMGFRLLGKNTMRQAFSESSASYRVNRQARPRSHMKNQF